MHLRTLAKALGLPTSSSPDQLRQCVEGIVQRDRDHRNVMVEVQEFLKTEQVVTLEDSEVSSCVVILCIGMHLPNDMIGRRY